jgi:trigger factor
MEKERDDYHAIAERRVRLGLLLSDIGQRNGVDISSQEMNQLIMQAAQQYRPADREKFVQYVRDTPMAAAQLRAPLFEDKVVDYLFSKAEISDRSVTREELEREIEAEDGAGHVHGPGCGHDHHDHDHGAEAKPAKKARKAKAAEAEAAPAEAAPAEDKPARKAKAKKADAPAEEAAAEEPAAEAKPKKKAGAKKKAADAE